ncbi:MAG: hypothetical protein WD068_01315 [Candidatus Babeliales bacterium]
MNKNIVLVLLSIVSIFFFYWIYIYQSPSCLSQEEPQEQSV